MEISLTSTFAMVEQYRSSLIFHLMRSSKAPTSFGVRPLRAMSSAPLISSYSTSASISEMLAFLPITIRSRAFLYSNC